MPTACCSRHSAALSHSVARLTASPQCLSSVHHIRLPASWRRKHCLLGPSLRETHTPVPAGQVPELGPTGCLTRPLSAGLHCSESPPGPRPSLASSPASLLQHACSASAASDPRLLALVCTLGPGAPAQGGSAGFLVQVLSSGVGRAPRGGCTLHPHSRGTRGTAAPLRTLLRPPTAKDVACRAQGCNLSSCLSEPTSQLDATAQPQHAVPGLLSGWNRQGPPAPPCCPGTLAPGCSLDSQAWLHVLLCTGHVHADSCSRALWRGPPDPLLRDASTLPTAHCPLYCPHGCHRDDREGLSESCPGPRKAPETAAVQEGTPDLW